MRSLKRFLIPLAAMAGVLAFVAPASAAPGATINSVTNSGCTIQINVTFADAGPYFMEIWDDGRRLDKQTITTDTADKNVTFQFVVVRPIGQSPPGLAVIFAASSNVLAGQADIDFKGSENCSPPPLTLDPSATTEPPATTEVPTTGGPITEPPTTMAPPTTAAPTTVTPGGSVAPATGARPVSGKANYTG